MQKQKPRTSLLETGLSIALVLIIWAGLAPTQLGGWVTYAIVDGNSMETKFHRGDLVLARSQSAYQTGDAVVYKNAELHRYVFHRIVGMDQGHFIMKGDNNNWLDSYEPAQNEILGKLWIHIPGLGKGMEWVRQPIGLAIVLVLIGGVLMVGMFYKPSQQKRNPAGSFGNLGGGLLEGLLLMAGLLTVFFLGLTVFAFTRPAQRPADMIQYQQQGYFYYSAAGTPGVYDTNTIQPGEPVFPKLTCYLNVGFAYDILGNGLQNISGRHQFMARIIEEQSGWTRTLPLESPTPFSGNTFFSMSTLDLCQVEALVDSVEQQTGLHASVYTLELAPQIAIVTSAAGQVVNDTFNPALTFKFDKAHFFIASNNTETQNDPFHVTQTGFIPSAALQTNTISVLGEAIPVSVVRAMALLGLMLSLAGLAATVWYFFNTLKENQEAFIRLKYGQMMMNVYEHMLEPSTRIVDVASMDDLAKLAERQNTMIQHMTLNFLHYYLVQCNGVTYRHVITTGRKGIPEITAAPQPLLYSGNFSNEREVLETELISEDIFNYRPTLDSNQQARINQADTQMMGRIRL